VADCHERESRQEQTPPAERVDCPECRQCKDKVDDAEAERCEQGWCWLGSRSQEDYRAVVCDYVDAAELVRQLDMVSSQGWKMQDLFSI
jgi:hypothetical protein